MSNGMTREELHKAYLLTLEPKGVSKTNWDDTKEDCPDCGYDVQDCVCDADCDECNSSSCGCE